MSLSPAVDERSASLTIGPVAMRFGVHDWKIRHAIRRGFIPEPRRVGRFRVFGPDDMPTVEAGLRAAGYLRDQRPEAAAC